MGSTRWRATSAGLGCAALVLAGCARPAATQTAGSPADLQLLPPGAVWAPNPAIPPGASIALVAGKLAGPGLYAFRLRMPPGYRVMPHTHPDERVYTVLSGTWYIGLGERFDSTAQTAVPAGGVYVLPAGVPHYHWAATGESVSQIIGTGPTATVYLDPADDPRKAR